MPDALVNTSTPPVRESWWRRTLAPVAGMAALGAMVAGLWAVDRQRESSERSELLATAERHWQATVSSLREQREKLDAEALEPIDQYFDETALPSIGPFLAEFSGLFDTPKFVYKWTADKAGFYGSSGRIESQVKAALAQHLKFPDAFTQSVSAATERYEALQVQTDTELRDQAYQLLHGAGIDIRKEDLAAIQRQSLEAAKRATIGQLSQDTATSFGGVYAGKELTVIAVQMLVLPRVMAAVVARAGIVTTGSAAAAGTAAGGTLAGPAAPVAYAVAAGEIVLAVVIDLALSYWLESRAEKNMHQQLDLVRDELKQQLTAYFDTYADQIDAQRATLLNSALKRSKE